MVGKQRFRTVGLLIGVTFALAAVAPSARASDAPATPGFSPGSFIFNSPDSDLFFDMDRMAALGAKWVRLDIPWASIEEFEGQFYWDSTDRLVNAARQRGMQVVGILHTTPSWARAAGTSFLSPPTDLQKWTRFVRAAVQRYVANVTVWEVWNEPNISVFWNPQPDPVAYTALLKETYAAVHAAAAGRTVLFGGLAPAADRTDGKEISPLTFLRRVYAEGGRGSFDAMAMHPYSYPALPTDPTTAEWNQFQKLPEIYDVMVENGDGHKKIWLTEYGAPTGTAPGAVSQEVQAASVTEAYDAAAEWSWVGPLLWYSHRDSGTDLADREQNFGLLQNDFTPKQAVQTYARTTGVSLLPIGDYDGDGKTDVAVFRPASGTWYIRGGSPAEVNFGISTDVPVPGDYNGDGKTDVAVFRPASGTWYIRGGSPAEVNFGISTDVPVPGDYNGDGKTDVAVFRPASGTWYIRGGSPAEVSFGISTDVPVPGDYNGDGKTDVAVFRPASGTWYIRGGSPAEVSFGISTDIPVPGDYDGDGKTDVAVFRPASGTWYIRGGSPAEVSFGISTDVPVPGDYNGDGKTDVAVFRPASGTWYIRGGSPAEVSFGISTDIPVPGDYDGDGKTDVAVFRPASGTWYIRGGSPAEVPFGISTDVPLSDPLSRPSLLATRL